jgi:hypothetical protein
MEATGEYVWSFYPLGKCSFLSCNPDFALTWLVAIPLMNGLILGGIFVLVRKIFQKRK